MLVYLSGLYAEQDIALRYGALPSAFLPLNGKRLYQVQLSAFPSTEPKLMTLPKDFDLPEIDAHNLKKLNITILRTENDLTLVEALKGVLDHLEGESSISVLFGGTFIEDDSLVQMSGDFVAVKPTCMAYPWTYIAQTESSVTFLSEPGSDRSALCGYIGFSDLPRLKSALENVDFRSALNAYNSDARFDTFEPMRWFDFGHLDDFIFARRNFQLTRDFNSLKSSGHKITKSSHQTNKMKAEINWYKNLPDKIVPHTPQYLGAIENDRKYGYELEYLEIPVVNEIAVFGKTPAETWVHIINECVELIKKFRTIRPINENVTRQLKANFFDQNVIKKTWDRVNLFCEQSNYSIKTEFRINGLQYPPWFEVIETVLGFIPPSRDEHISFWHGDFYFGNLFFDYVKNRVVMVDPRGCLHDGRLSVYGDFRYDLGKLGHSVIGGYDHIVHNQYIFSDNSRTDFDIAIPGLDEIGNLAAKEQFIERIETEFDMSYQDILAWSALMFFSMLPLHQEDSRRQRALLAAGMNLYHGLVEGNI